MREIATALGVSKWTARRRAAREGWPYRAQRVRGGRRRLYPAASLPADVRAALGESDDKDLPPGHYDADVRMRQPDGRGSQQGAATAASARPLRAPQDPLSGGNGCPATSPAHPSGMKSGEGAPPNQETPTSIPSRARTRETAPDPAPPAVDPALEASLAAHFDGLTAARRAECEALVPVFDRAVATAARPKSRSMRPALEAAAAELDCERSPHTLYSAWLGRRGRPGLKSLPRRLWAAALAPRYIGCTAMAECSPRAWDAWKADYLRAEQPTAAHSHRLVLRLAGSSGWSAPRSAATFLRRLRREVPNEAVVLARQGPEAVARLRPAQVRDRAALVSMECVSADGHRFDAFARFPDGKRKRPMLVAWQDMRSGSILGWHLGPEETADAYRCSFAAVLRDHGIPEHVVVDNGRGIASHAMTGQSPNRYRHSYREDEPIGLLTQLVGKDNIHWTTPYHGQSKPIERAFRDLAMDIARDVRLAGAYAGSSTERKPHNYSSKAAVPLERFEAVCADGIRQHNARRGRRGMGMEGRSFDEVFEACLDPARTARPTEAQLERWLLVPKGVTARSSDGSVAVGQTRWWHPDLAREFGGAPAERRKAIVRWDPSDLSRPARVELPDGRLVARAEAQSAQPVLGKQAAEERAKEAARLKKGAREQLETHRTLSVRDLVAMVDEAAGTRAAQAKPPAMAKVVTGAFGLERPDPPAERKESPADILILEAVKAAGGGSL